MRLPAEEPAQEPAPAVDEAACFNLVPVVPMHMIAGASPGSPSETVVEAEEHAMAVSPYPYYLQPAQDAPAEPVAGADVREEPAEVPQPRQWADEGGWDSRAVFMPVSEAVPVAATAAEDNQNLFTEPPPGERGLQRNDGDGPSGVQGKAGSKSIRCGCNEDESVFLPIAVVDHAARRHLEHPNARAQSTRILRSAARRSHGFNQIAASRNSFGALCAVSGGSARRASERTSTRMRGLGGGAIDGAPSCASCGRESERSDGSTRAREGQQVRSFKVGTFIYPLIFMLGVLGAFLGGRRCGFDTGDSADALVARWTGRAAACAGVRCPGRAQSVRRRHSLDCAELEVVYSGAGGYK
ncbi:hypothetical protein FB451DRAFT_1562726 [Mycena latifolia]|nr:hypothetical protein FB451DRAFT_1562726 [Mycena latifolia]